MKIGGLVQAFGVPLRGVEVLAVAGSKVAAVTVTDDQGRYELPDPQGDRGSHERIDPDRVVARFYEPFVGVLVAAAGPAVDFEVALADVIHLKGTFQAPADVTFDWVDLKLTPRVEVPPVVVLHEPEGLREAYWSRRFIQPTFSVRVLKGTWEVRAGREVDGPLTVKPQHNLVMAALVLEDGTRPEARFGGFEASFTRDSSMSVELRTV